jgi:hypothetical protein
MHDEDDDHRRRFVARFSFRTRIQRAFPSEQPLPPAFSRSGPLWLQKRLRTMLQPEIIFTSFGNTLAITAYGTDEVFTMQQVEAFCGIASKANHHPSNSCCCRSIFSVFCLLREQYVRSSRCSALHEFFEEQLADDGIQEHAKKYGDCSSCCCHLSIAACSERGSSSKCPSF